MDSNESKETTNFHLLIRRLLQFVGIPNRLLTAAAFRHLLRRTTLALAALLAIAVAALAGAWIAFPFPIERLEQWPASPVVTDRHGRALMERVASDDQWRRPVSLAEISPWLVQATIAVEDRRFYAHPGVDPLAVARALAQDLRAGRRVSGASTITMQLCRMIDERPRTWSAKAIESFRALQLEQLRDKDQILAAYLNAAPYGGNLRGAEAAARAWFGKRAAELSLAEAALLAGLPQSPRGYRPDRHPGAALARRANVLRRMTELGLITREQQLAAADEPMPARRRRHTVEAPHAAALALARRPRGGQTTIDLDVQREVERLARENSATLPAGADLAAVVVNIATGDIVALVGSLGYRDPVAGQVNGALARRAPGSTLKPFVYAAAFADGRLSPESIVHDIPIDRAGWSPSNFDRTHSGPLPAAEALRRSLNVPAILVAEGTGLARCVGLVRSVGVELPSDAESRSGLAVVVGATEVTLVDLVNGYATLGRGGVRRPTRLFLDEPTAEVSVLDPNVCAAIDDILCSRRRRPHGTEQADPADVPWFMWKTGTSSGRRDAWAVGHNRRYAIGVWVGRFSGAGQVELVGAERAEPLLASLFSLPTLRSDDDPTPPRSWTVTRPLAPPGELAGPLRIASPHDGAIYLAVSGTAAVHPRANRTEELAWFLNGRLLTAEAVDRLLVEPGRHELRCVDAVGVNSAVRFTVRY